MLKAKFSQLPIRRLAVLAAWLVPAAAFAGTPTRIDIAHSATAHSMRISADQKEYWVYTAGAPQGTGCFNVSEDLLKEWQTIAQTALVANKSLVFSESICNGTKRLLTNVTVGQ